MNSRSLFLNLRKIYSVLESEAATRFPNIKYINTFPYIVLKGINYNEANSEAIAIMVPRTNKKTNIRG